MQASHLSTLATLAAMMFADGGTSGIGLGNPDTADNVFGALAAPIMGQWG